MVTLTVPFVDGIDRVVIKEGATIVADEGASPNPPVVRILEPQGGAILASGIHTIKWEAFDPDGDPLNFLIQYSPDDGESWQGIDLVNVLETQFDVGELIPGQKGFIRITASDGFNTTVTKTGFISVGTTDPPPPPSLVSDVHDIYPYDAPVTFSVMTSDTCGDVDLVLNYGCYKVNKKGKVISKLDSCDVVINGNQVTIVDSGGVGTIITISATATDECGNTSSEDFVVNVHRPANEGVGNGVDANTLGHDNNGGNDDPGVGPGKPGAKKKKKKK
jgi:hypothetical protein